MLLIRLFPVFPFKLLNYAYAVTLVTLKDYILGSIGMLPGTVMYVYLGYLARSLTVIANPNQPANSQATTVQWIILGLTHFTN